MIEKKWDEKTFDGQVTIMDDESLNRKFKVNLTAGEKFPDDRLDSLME